MKKMILAMMTMLAMTIQANAMSYEQARNEALFLTDKMAYELNLTDAQYEAAYEINLDYLMGVTSQGDVFGTYWERRNLDLSYILYSWQWDAFRAATYFYRPLYWDAGFWHFGIYARYPRRDYFYFGRPHFYATYRGAHSWHMNGGRSYYHGRVDHFRPAIAAGREHFGMRNSFDRGDFRGSRGNSSTRITAGRPSGGNRSFSIGGGTPNSNSNVRNRSFSTQQGGASAPQRSFSVPQRSAGSQSSMPQRSSGSLGAAPQRSSGSSHSAGSGRSAGTTRNSGSTGSSRSGSGHFGGSRR